jgi:hypothetical protein
VAFWRVVESQLDALLSCRLGLLGFGPGLGCLEYGSAVLVPLEGGALLIRGLRGENACAGGGGLGLGFGDEGSALGRACVLVLRVLGSEGLILGRRVFGRCRAHGTAVLP